MRDFETHPIGTAEKIRRLEERLDAYEVVIVGIAAVLFGTDVTLLRERER